MSRGRSLSAQQYEPLDLADLGEYLETCPIEVLRADWLNLFVDAAICFPDMTPGAIVRALLPAAERLGRVKFETEITAPLRNGSDASEQIHQVRKPETKGITMSNPAAPPAGGPFTIRTGDPPPPKPGTKSINPIDNAVARLRAGEYVEIPEADRKFVSIKARLAVLEKEGTIDRKNFQVYATARSTTVIQRLGVAKA